MISNKAAWLISFKTIILTAAFACATSISVPAANETAHQKCQQTKVTPSVDFIVKNADVRLNKSRTSDQITRFAAKSKQLKLQRGHKLLGLAHVELQYQLNIGTSVLKIGNRYCVALNNIAISFGRKHSEIYVASKYLPGTCEFKAVLRHEQEHMEINDRIQKKYEAKLREYLLNKVESIQPYFTTSPNNAPKQLASRFAGETDRIIKQFSTERLRENNKIDTPQSYRKVRSQCAKW